MGPAGFCAPSGIDSARDWRRSVRRRSPDHRFHYLPPSALLGALIRVIGCPYSRYWYPYSRYWYPYSHDLHRYSRCPYTRGVLRESNGNAHCSTCLQVPELLLALPQLPQLHLRLVALGDQLVDLLAELPASTQVPE